MRATLRRAILALLLLLLASGVARAQQLGPGEVEVLRDGQFIVYSDAPLTKDQARKLIDRMKAAYSFVKAEQHWTDETVLDHDLAFRVLTDEHMKARAKKAIGLTIDANTFLMAESFLEKERSEETIAHELTHIQDRRHLAKGTKVPHYLSEGRAIDEGHAFGAKIKTDLAAHESRLARTLLKVTAKDARRILTEDAYTPNTKIPSVPRMEAVGFFFIDFVRVRPGGTAVPAIEPKLAKVVEAIGKGTTLEDAWKAEFGEPLADVQAAFLDFMEKTEGKPERFKGTILEKADLKPPAATPRDPAAPKDPPKDPPKDAPKDSPADEPRPADAPEKP
jgi:hypothetical protein